MWFLSFIPDAVLQWFIHSIVFLGLVLTLGGSILSKIPFINSYSGFFKLFGVPLLVIGVFFEGGYATEMMWRGKVKEMQEKVRISEEQSNLANKNLSTALSNQKGIIDSTNKKILDDLNKWKNEINSNCKVSPKAIEILNESAKKPVGKK